MAKYKCRKCNKIMNNLTDRCDCSKKFIISAAILLVIGFIWMIFNPEVGSGITVLAIIFLVTGFKCGSSSTRDRLMLDEIEAPEPMFRAPDVHHIVQTNQINVPVEKTTVNNNYNQSQNINLNGAQIGQNAVIALNYNDNKSNFNNNNNNQNISGNNNQTPIFAPNNQGNITVNAASASPQQKQIPEQTQNQPQQQYPNYQNQPQQVQSQIPSQAPLYNPQQVPQQMPQYIPQQFQQQAPQYAPQPPPVYAPQPPPQYAPQPSAYNPTQPNQYNPQQVPYAIPQAQQQQWPNQQQKNFNYPAQNTDDSSAYQPVKPPI